MKNLFITLTLILSSLLVNSQIIKLKVTGLQNYSRPVNENISESINSDHIIYTDFGFGDCDYIFDLDSQKFVMNDIFGEYHFEGKITKVNKNDNILDVSVGGCDFILGQFELNDELVFIIEYKNSLLVDGSFATSNNLKVIE
jgi:hypothetical protein